MTNVVKFLSTRSFFQLGAELKREKYNHNTDRNTNRQLWVAFFITFVFFIWAVYALIKYQSVLPGWIVVLGILLLFAPAGPLLTLILVYYSVGSIKGTDSDIDITETMTIDKVPPPEIAAQLGTQVLPKGTPPEIAAQLGGRAKSQPQPRSHRYYTPPRSSCRHSRQCRS
jgi:hypothetical protein